MSFSGFFYLPLVVDLSKRSVVLGFLILYRKSILKHLLHTISVFHMRATAL